MTTTVPSVAEVDRVVANLRTAREPVYDPTDPVQVAAVQRLRAEQDDAPVRITCPGTGCRGEAWRLPDGAVYCLDTKSMVPEDPDEVPVIPRQYIEDPEKLLTLVLVAADEYGRAWDQGAYEAQVAAFGMALWTVFPPQPAEAPQRATQSVLIHGTDLKAGDVVVTDDHMLYAIERVEPASEEERVRAGCDELLVAVTTLGGRIEVQPDDLLYIVERPAGGVR